MKSNSQVNIALFSLVAAFFCYLQAQTSYKFDFGPGAVKSGYTQILSTTNYTAARGYGFDFYTSMTCVDRGGADSLLRDVCYGSGYSYFSMNLVEGNYTVTVTLGDPLLATTTTIKAESRRLCVEKVKTTAGVFSTKTFTVNRRNTAISTGGTVGVTTRELGGLNWDGNKLTLEFNNAHPSVASLEVVPANNPRQIFLAGNSTQCDWATETEAAWGQMFPRFFKPTAVVIGLAESGLTTSTFIGQRRLDKIMSLIHAGDYLFIEFGHNDMGSLTIAEYQTNLTTFITRARSANAIPVLVTPTARRSFNGSLAVNTFVNANGDYVAAMKQVATNNNVQVIDLNAMTTSFIEALGPAGSAVAYWYHDGTQDNTHFSDYGAYEVARMVVEGVRTGLPALVPYLADDVTPFNPAVPDSFSSWNFPLSADTSVWHYNGTGIAGNKVLSQLHGESFVPVPASSRVFYTVRERGNLLFAIYSLDGKEISKKNFVAREANGSFVWGELGRLPSGIYFLAIKSNNLNRAKIRFLKF